MSERGPDVLAAPPGAISRALVERLAAVECPAFGRRRETRAGAERSSGPLVLSRGEGHTVVDVDGNRYVDLAAGFGAALLGHGHPRLADAVRGQLDLLVQGMGDVYASDTKVALLEKLSAACFGGGSQVLLGQSGSDAVTAAIKTATLATGRHAFVAFDGGYHGLGYAPLPACGYQKGFRRPFEPQLNSSVHHAPFPGLRHASMDASLSFVEELLREYAVAAVLVEPIVGRGGCVVPPDGFLTELCALAHEHGTLVIADEIWTGMGRTGRFLRSEDDSGGADIVCLGKGLGGGLPISACIAPSAIMASWASSGEVVHTSTHAGAPLGCAAALAVLEVVQSEGLAERAQAVGARVLRHFREVLEEVAAVHEVRGAGLMIGIELSDAATAQGCLAGMLARGYLLLSGGIEGNVLTLTPALTIDEQALFDAALALRDVLSAAPPAR